MAAEDGGKSGGLSERLFAEPYRFDFFQAVRLLRWIARERAADDPRWTPQRPGEDAPPEREGIRFRSLPSQSFATSPVVEVRPTVPSPRARSPADGGDEPRRSPPVEMVVSFLGLTGPTGALPQHYTTLILQRLRQKDASLRDFLDLFNHRLVSLFYRAWEKYRLPFRVEQTRLGAGDAEELTTWVIYCLAGMGTGGLRGRLDIPDQAFLFYAGHFAHAPRCAVALEGILSDYFELPIRVLSLHGQWLHLGEGDRSRLAGGERGQNHHIGSDLIVGRRVWDVQSKFRLRIGPLTYAQFRRLLPIGDMLRPLGQFARTYAGPELDIDVQLVLLAAEVPRCRLALRGERSRLGWNTWILARTPSQDVDDAVFAFKEF